MFTVTFSPGKGEEVCVDTRSTIQNGGSRAYRFTFLGENAKILSVNATGTAIDHVELTLASGKRFLCEAEGCTGVVIGKRNAEGKRVIGLDSTLKLEADSGATESATISAKLNTMRDQDVSGLACIGQGVTLIGSDNSSVDFCPLGGHGFSMTEEGSKIFHFSNLENEEIRIEVGEDESLRKISFGGDDLACTAESCTGFSITPPNAKGERVLTFAGTVLTSRLASGETITLNGTLLQPAITDSGLLQ